MATYESARSAIASKIISGAKGSIPPSKVKSVLDEIVNASSDELDALEAALATTYQAKDADLTALAALGMTGFAVRSAANTWLQRSIAGTANEISVSNGDGVSGNPTVSLPSSLTFTGKTITGGTFASPAAITGLPSPTNSNDAATKGYVDSVAQGLNIKASVVVATTANITLSGAQTIDGVGVVAGNRVLVINQTAPAENGIYVAAAGAWSRATDMDAWSEVPGAFVFVESGSTKGSTSWVSNSATSGTLGTTAITFVQFGAASSYSADETTLHLTGTQFSVKDGGISSAKLASGAALANLAAASIPYAKIQNVSAPDRLLGRVTTGAGTIEEVVCTAAARDLLDDADAATMRTTLGVPATSHSHAASDISSGVIATARLGSGTANSSTYLRGDQTWATVSAGNANVNDQTSSSSTTYPVGTVVLCTTSGAHTLNSTATVYISDSQFNTSGTGSALSGTWRCCGNRVMSGDNIALFQRVA